MFQIEYVTIRNIVGDDFVKAKWKLMYELAKQYYEKNKNLRIPQTYQTEEEHLEELLRRNKLDIRINN